MPATRIQVAHPHPALGPYVSAYVEATQLAAETTQASAITSPVLAVTWGAPAYALVADGAASAMPFVSLTGVLTRPQALRADRGAVAFCVSFHPAGARALLGERPVADVQADGLSRDVERWGERVAEARTFAARVALADALLLSRLTRSGVWSESAVGLLVRSAGTMPVREVADRLGVAPRTLRRRFCDDLGVGVKTFAQIERYRQAHAFLLATPAATWLDACARYG